VSRFVKPEVVRLELSGGDWITVKNRLSAGEKRSIFALMVKSMHAGEKVAIDPARAQIAQLVVYLVDWSLTDDTGKLVPIKDAPAEFVMQALDNLDADSYAEIEQALERHLTAREEEKKALAPASES
jgi:hypothetical protein